MSNLPSSSLLPITRDFLVEIGGWPLLKQAQAMVEAGRVLGVAYQAPILSARVMSDDREIMARLKIGRRLSEVENLCTCRQAKVDGSICAHVMAAGVEWLRQRELAKLPAKPTPTSVPTAPVPSPAAPKWRCLIGSQPPEARLLEVRLLLPLNWPQVLTGPKLRVILEGRVEGEGDFRPWDALSRSGDRLYAVSEEDEALLAFIEQRHAGKVPGIWEVEAREYHRFLKTVAGHPKMWVGKKKCIHVRNVAHLAHLRNPGRPTLSLRGNDRGELLLSLREPVQKAGLLLPIPDATWRWIESEDALVEELTLPGAYAALRAGPVTIPPAHVVAFLEKELPALSRLVEIDSDGSVEKIEFERPLPHICATLEGSLPGLSLRLEAKYPTGERLLLHAQHPDRVPDEWQPVANRPLHYWKRNAEAETAARREAERAGFAPGHRSPENFFLSGERAVGQFLANVLPRWRQQWQVEFGTRMTNFVERLDYVEPEITLRESGPGNDWLSLDLQLRPASGGAALSPADVQRWLQTGSSHQRRDDDRILLVPTQGWEQMQQVLADCAVQQEAGRAGAARLSRNFAPYLAGAVEAQGWKLSDRSTWPPKEETHTPLPPLSPALAEKLRPYQKQGVDWLCGLAQRGFAGLLADEMGLGKTVQVLGLLDRLARANGDRNEATPRNVRTPTEIDTPRRSAPPLLIEGTFPSESLIAEVPSMKRGAPSGAGCVNPTSELALHTSPSLVICPTSLVENWHSEATKFAPHLRVLVLHGAKRHGEFERIAAHDLVITSYALLRRDLDRYLAHEFTAVVLDEAQHIKNRSSQNAQSAKALKAQHRFVLTGTPLENSLFDLWSIFDFLMPGYLGTAKDFKDRYEAPITREKDESVQQRLRLRMRPFFLRRTKEEVVKELPAKLEQVALCDLTEEQTEVYQAILEQGRREVFEGSGKSGQGQNRLAVLSALLRLRQAACHLSLLPKPENGQAPEWKEPSGKFDLSFELLNEAIDGGHRVLVFSQFVQLLHLFRAELDKQEIGYCYLDGSTVNRADVVNRFQSDATIPVFLISLKAGGVGLNLTGADTVLHLDPWWNPAVEDQATARAHRIGQTRVVTAYKVIARGTVEEKILALQERKKELIAANMSNETVFVESLTMDEMKGLFE